MSQANQHRIQISSGRGKAAIGMLAFSIGLGSGQAALAQGDVYKPTGSRVGRPAPAQAPDNVTMSPIDVARATVNQFADCIVRNDKKLTAACLWDGNLTMPQSLLRGAIFRAAYNRDFASRALTFSEQPIDYAVYLEEQKSPEAVRYLVLLDFADCVVRAEASNARAFAIAIPGSKGEKDALAVLQPQLGPCFPAGVNVTFNKSILSAVLAEALYREVEAGQMPLAEASR
jgi:hypothetical protein